MKYPEQKFRALLKPMYPLLERIVREGFKDYFAECRDALFKHTSRTRSTAVNDDIVALASQILPGLGFIERSVKGRRLFEFGDKFILHFKKLDRRMRHSNYPTLFALEFDKQAEIPGIIASTPRLIVGYVLNQFKTEIESVHITCPAGKGVDWSIDVTFENLASSTETKPIELPGITNVTRTGKSSKRIKRDEKPGQQSAES